MTPTFKTFREAQRAYDNQSPEDYEFADVTDDYEPDPPDDDYDPHGREADFVYDPLGRG